MKKWVIWTLALAVVPASAESIEKANARRAATRSVALMQNVSTAWFKRQTCVSCHHQILPMMALEVARERGVQVNEDAARKVAVKTFAQLKDFDVAVQYLEQIDPALSDANILLAAHASGIQPNLMTAVYARQIGARQRRDGSWYSFDSRPPQSQSRFTATAVALRALQLYMPAQLADESRNRVDAARKWLLTKAPQNTEESTARLQGLSWAGADPADVQKARKQLLSEQRADGGWSQIAGRASDAYATGEVMVTLHRAAGVAVDDPAWQRGVRYLLKTQQPDGSWQVTTRIAPPAMVSPPYFESGFPYGHSQFISCAGTAWASTALMLTLDKVTPKPPDVDGVAAVSTKLPLPQATLEAVLFGTSEELQQLLDGGLDVNIATPEGTTLLMMAAGNPDKVKLLVARGANVNARARTGFNALMVASNYTGSAGTVRFLLDHGAEVKAPAGVKMRYDASALFFAATAGETETVGLLLDRGADIEQRMLMLGSVPASPMEMAVSEGDLEMVRYLIRRGANVNRPQNMTGYTPLFLSVFAGYPAVTQELISAGAKVDVKDTFGMTPLLYASSYNLGHADIVGVLLKAGADRTAHDKAGRTSLVLAKKYGIPNASALLQ